VLINLHGHDENCGHVFLCAPGLAHKKARKTNLPGFFVLYWYGLLVGVNGNLFTVTSQAFKGYDAFDQREQGVVLTAAHIVARMNLGAALTVNDVTGLDGFAAEFLASKTLTA
jgi:hypothetical protein